MASPKAKATHERRSRTSCFTSCFGCLPEAKTGVSTRTRATGERRSSRWWCWRSAKGSRRKTVPLDMVALQDVTEEGTSHKDKVMNDPRPTDDRRGKKVKSEDPPEASTSTPKASHLLVLKRPKPDPTKKTAGSQPSPPASELAQSTMKSLRQSPPSIRQQEARRRWRPTLKMSILVVALAITPIWGRLCAILSTTAWSYLLPWLEMAAEPADVAGFSDETKVVPIG